jgi:hypothetical protein
MRALPERIAMSTALLLAIAIAVGTLGVGTMMKRAIRRVY